MDWTRSVCGALAALGLLAATATEASAQQRFGRYGDRDVQGDFVPLAKIGLEVGVRAFGASPVGTGFELGSSLSTQDDADYSDLFGLGVGFGIGAWMPIHVKEPGDRALEVTIGPLLAIDRVTYPGGDFTDQVGTRIEPDDMVISRVLAGFHLRLRVGRATSPVRFLFGAQIGIGAAFIDQVDADLFVPAQTPGTLYDSTTTFAFELIVRPGISFQLAPRLSLSVSLLLGFDVMGPPENADGPGNPIAPADAGPILDGIFGVGVTLTIRFPG